MTYQLAIRIGLFLALTTLGALLFALPYAAIQTEAIASTVAIEQELANNALIERNRM